MSRHGVMISIVKSISESFLFSSPSLSTSYILTTHWPDSIFNAPSGLLPPTFLCHIHFFWHIVKQVRQCSFSFCVMSELTYFYHSRYVKIPGYTMELLRSMVVHHAPDNVHTLSLLQDGFGGVHTYRISLCWTDTPLVHTWSHWFVFMVLWGIMYPVTAHCLIMQLGPLFEKFILAPTMTWKDSGFK